MLRMPLNLKVLAPAHAEDISSLPSWSILASHQCWFEGGSLKSWSAMGTTAAGDMDVDEDGLEGPAAR